MNEWTDEEVEMLSHLLDELSDKMNHYPNDYSAKDFESFGSLRAKVSDEAKQRKFWWAR